MWYQSHECGLRIAMMYSVAVAGDSFNDLVGNAILRLDGRAGLGGWCWLFIMEGSVTLVAGKQVSKIGLLSRNLLRAIWGLTWINEQLSWLSG